MTHLPRERALAAAVGALVLMFAAPVRRSDQLPRAARVQGAVILDIVVSAEGEVQATMTVTVTFALRDP